MKKVKRYAKYKAEGKCPNCLKPTGKRVYCEDCRKKAQQKYLDNIGNKFCADCNTQLPFTGRFRGKRCKPCAKKVGDEKMRVWYENPTPEHLEKRRRYQREYARRVRKENPERSWDRRLKRRYGITFDDFKTRYKNQKGECAICCTGLPDPQVKKSLNGLHIDHNHKTGIVRGILCPQCNMGLGLFKDSIDILKSAIRYIK